MTRACALRVFCLALCLFGLAFTSISFAQQTQQPQQDTDLPADDIIQILQDDPELLAEAKAQIIAQLRDRGYAVTEKEITNDRLFSEIRSDDRARIAMSNELKKRGYGVQDNEPATDQQNPNGQKPPGPQKTLPGETTGANQPAANVPANQTSVPARQTDQKDITKG